MDTDSGRQSDTRRRVLESALALFAEKGYAETSLTDICGLAEANKAAVNYHFRSKENLYAEAWRSAFERSQAAHPLGEGLSPSASPEERLRMHILAMSRRIADPETREFDIIQKERANPTGLLAEIMREAIVPVREYLRNILVDLLGPSAQPIHVRLCQASVMSLCMHICLQERPGGMDFPRPPKLGLDMDAIAEHIYRFSLAGIRDVRERIERGDVLPEERTRDED